VARTCRPHQRSNYEYRDRNRKPTSDPHQPSHSFTRQRDPIPTLSHRLHPSMRHVI
jgi:hypothetical protein